MVQKAYVVTSPILYTTQTKPSSTSVPFPPLNFAPASIAVSSTIYSLKQSGMSTTNRALDYLRRSTQVRANSGKSKGTADDLEPLPNFSTNSIANPYIQGRSLWRLANRAPGRPISIICRDVDLARLRHHDGGYAVDFGRHGSLQVLACQFQEGIT